MMIVAFYKYIREKTNCIEKFQKISNNDNDIECVIKYVYTNVLNIVIICNEKEKKSTHIS